MNSLFGHLVYKRSHRHRIVVWTCRRNRGGIDTSRQHAAHRDRLHTRGPHRHRPRPPHDELSRRSPRHITHTHRERETCSLYAERATRTTVLPLSTTETEFSTALSLPNTPHTRTSCCCECTTRIMLTDLVHPLVRPTPRSLFSSPRQQARRSERRFADQRERGPVSTPAPVMRPGCPR